MLLDGDGGVDGDLIVGRIAVLDAEVVVLQLHIEVLQDQLILDELPDDAGHLVAIELDDGVVDLDLRHDCCLPIGSSDIQGVQGPVVLRDP